MRQISIHALRKESDRHPDRLDGQQAIFQSTLSVRRATATSDHHADLVAISIHALRKESDMDAWINVIPSMQDFNPRSP